MMITTRFINAEICLQGSCAQLHQAIEAELQKRGEPLRWAITQIDAERQVAQVEAIVTLNAESTEQN